MEIRTRTVGIELHGGHALVLIEREPEIHVLILGVKVRVLVIHDRDVCPRTHMPVKHLMEGGVKDRVAAAQNDVLLRAAPHIPKAGAECVHRAAVQPCAVLREKGRQDEQTLALSVQIPFLACAEMIHERMVVLLRDESDACHSRMHKVGKDEVHTAVSAAEGQRRDRARQGQVAHFRIVFTGVDETKGAVDHTLSS